VQLGGDVGAPRRLHKRERDLADAIHEDAGREPLKHTLTIVRE
jgi:hypothetical protein